MQTVLIKRFTNRKLYIPKGNTEKSGYITIKGIAGLIEKGKSVKVVDDKTGEDLTVEVLISALKKVKDRLSVDRLMELIRG